MGRWRICLFSLVVGPLACERAVADLVAHWSFNEGAGTAANDSAGPFFSNGTLLAGAPEPIPN